jgi:hypothetical protein
MFSCIEQLRQHKALTIFAASIESSPTRLFLISPEKPQVWNFHRSKRAIGTTVAKANHDKKAEGSNRVSSLIEVARRFGGGALHLSSGGSFGGTELPITVIERKGEAADEAPCQRLGGASTGLISSH